MLPGDLASVALCAKESWLMFHKEGRNHGLDWFFERKLS